MKINFKKLAIWVILSLIVGLIILSILGLSPFSSEGPVDWGSFIITGLALGSLVHVIVNALGFKPSNAIYRGVASILPKRTSEINPINQRPLGLNY